jgi:hypothetical protein
MPIACNLPPVACRLSALLTIVINYANTAYEGKKIIIIGVEI